MGIMRPTVTNAPNNVAETSLVVLRHGVHASGVSVVAVTTPM